MHKGLKYLSCVAAIGLGTTIGATGAVIHQVQAAEGMAQVPFVTGGIGADERQEIASKAAGYPLKIETALSTGHFISDAEVTVSDKQGRVVLRETVDGPYIYANVTPGYYKIHGIWEGQTQHRGVTIGENQKGHKEVTLLFRGESDPDAWDASLNASLNDLAPAAGKAPADAGEPKFLNKTLGTAR